MEVNTSKHENPGSAVSQNSSIEHDSFQVSSQPIDQTEDGFNNTSEKGNAVGTFEPLSRQPTEPLFSIFSSGEKTFIVIMASLAALFSPLSANIYYPALETLANDLHVSNSLINLTVTTYLIFQGLAPMFVGAIADAKGRRPAYIICFTIYIAACIGLALQTNYAALMVLRCVQSSGSSGTVALASAVVADCVTSSERGTYMGYALMGGLLGPAVGPIIGGLLDKFLGWRSIFWFLVIFGSIVIAIIAIFLPETARNVVGNGSIPAQRWNISLVSYLRLHKIRKAGESSETTTRMPRQRLNPMKSIYILFDKESGPLLFFAGIIFAGFYMVITSLPSQLSAKFHYNSLQIGLVYIPSGVGFMIAAVVMGKFMDWNFRRHAKAQGMEISKQKQQDLSNFPIERVRLEIVVPCTGASVLLTIAYGWVMEKAENIGAIVVLLFFMSLAFGGVSQGINTLIVDLNRSSPGAATGAMNLARCLLGAGGVALVGPLIDRVGNGWMAVIVTASWIVLSPLIILVMHRGQRWRKKKSEKEAEKKAEKERDQAGGGEEAKVA